MTARLASVIRRWVGWAARWRGRRGRDRRRWPRFRPDSRRRRFSMPRRVTPVPDGRWRAWPPAIPASAQNPWWASRASDCAFPQRPGRQHRPRAPSRPHLSAACPGLWPSYSVMSHRPTIRFSACCGGRPALASLRNVAAPALGWFSIRMVSAGRIVYWMSASWMHRLGAGLVVGDEHHGSLFSRAVAGGPG